MESAVARFVAGEKRRLRSALLPAAERLFPLDLRSFRVVARRLRDRSGLGLDRLEIRPPGDGFGPFLRVSGRVE
jgi:hypothetical protein